MNRPLKPSTAIDEQLTLLANRGMVISDQEHARRWLTQVGYYRISGYFYPYRLPSQTGSEPRQGNFVGGTTFQSVSDLYEFDRKLRTLVHDATERVEVALRAQVSRILADQGPESYRDADTFRDAFDHPRWLRTVEKRINRASSRSNPIKHYRAHYGGRVPIWVAMDALDFADVSQAFEGLPSEDQRAVGDALGITIDPANLSKNQRQKVNRHHPLTRWFEKLTVMRNTAAHHSRLWNRTMVPAGTTALKTVAGLESLASNQSEKVYDALLLTNKLLTSISPGTSWNTRIVDLIDSLEKIPGRSAQEMGFPLEWRKIGVWR